MRDVLPVVLAVLALVAGSSSLGCAESRDPLPPGSRDADTGAIDAIFGSDAGATPPRSAEASMGDGAACLDFEDNDLNGLMDCEEQDCRSSAVSASCCVGRTDEACCTTERVDEVTGSGAAPATLHLRDQTLTTMGGTVYPGAILTTCDVRVDAAFAPIGNDSLSGYLALPSGYAPRSGYLTIEARIGLEEREVGEPAAAPRLTQASTSTTRDRGRRSTSAVVPPAAGLGPARCSRRTKGGGPVTCSPTVICEVVAS